jgi:membrane protein implicated in regulation of membrane protease activity
MPIVARIVVVALLVSLGAVEAAYAYIGPGAGLSMLSAFWGLLLAVFAALGFILFYPLRRLMRRNAKRQPLPRASGEQELPRDNRRTGALKQT